MAFLDSLKSFGQDIQKTLFGTSKTSGGTSNSPLAYKPPSTYQPPQNTQLNKSITGAALFGSSYNQPYNSNLNYNNTLPKVNNTILSSQLTTAPTPFSYTEPTTSLSELSATNANYGTVTPPKSPRETALGKYSELQDMLGTQADVQAKLEKEQQYEQKAQKVADLNAQYAQVERQFEKRIRDIDKTFNTPEQYNAQVQEISRKKEERLADIAILQQAAQGNLQVANDIIKRKIDAQFEPIKAQIQATKDWLALYSDDLTKSEQIMLESQLKQQEATLESEQNNALIQQGANSYAQAVSQGTMELKDVPKEFQASASAILNQSGFISPKEQASAEKAQNTLTIVNDLLGGKLGLEVGPGWQRTLGTVLSFAGFGGSREARIAKMDQLKALMTFENLSQLKGLGAMSDREFATITASASALNRATSESEFKKELLKITGVLTDKLIVSPAVSKDMKEDLLIQKLTIENPKMSPEDIAETATEILSFSDFKRVGNTSASNRPQRNNNPLNIKASAFTKSFSGVSGLDPVPASDGGQFLTFASPEAGFQAAKRLITSQGYLPLTVDKALRRWSNNGYGAEIVPALKNKTISQLSAQELDTLVKTMASREGFFA